VLLVWVYAFELQTRDAPPNIDQASSWCFKPCFLCFFLVTVPVNRFVFLRFQGRNQHWWISSVRLFDSFGVWVCYGLGLVRLQPFAVESCGLSPWVWFSSVSFVSQLEATINSDQIWPGIFWDAPWQNKNDTHNKIPQPYQTDSSTTHSHAHLGMHPHFLWGHQV
jgi:hypothetical protein